MIKRLLLLASISIGFVAVTNATSQAAMPNINLKSVGSQSAGGDATVTPARYYGYYGGYGRRGYYGRRHSYGRRHYYGRGYGRRHYYGRGYGRRHYYGRGYGGYGRGYGRGYGGHRSHGFSGYYR